MEKSKIYHLLINEKKSKEGQVLLLVICRYLFIFIKNLVDNLIVNTKLKDDYIFQI